MKWARPSRHLAGDLPLRAPRPRRPSHAHADAQRRVAWGPSAVSDYVRAGREFRAGGPPRSGARAVRCFDQRRPRGRARPPGAQASRRASRSNKGAGRVEELTTRREPDGRVRPRDAPRACCNASRVPKGGASGLCGSLPRGAPPAPASIVQMCAESGNRASLDFSDRRRVSVRPVPRARAARPTARACDRLGPRAP